MSAAVDLINALQKRIRAGEDPEPEEMAAAIRQLRAERGVSSAARADNAAKKAEIAAIDIASLFAPKAPS